MNTRKRILACIGMGLVPLVSVGIIVYLVIEDFVHNIPLIFVAFVCGGGWVCIIINWMKKSYD